MNYLSHYIEQGQTNAFNQYGAFFAFSDKQFSEKKQDGIKYASVGSGLIVPTNNIDDLLNTLDKVHQTGIDADIAENGIKAIIHRELANHESQITMDYSDALSALDGYGISEQQVKDEWKEFFQHCIDNDYF